MTIEMFLKFVAVLMFAGFMSYINLKTGSNKWNKRISFDLTIAALGYSVYLIWIS